MRNPVIITGATGAIGSCIARALAEAGHDLMLGCRDRGKGERLLASLAGLPGERQIFDIDLADSGSVRRAAERLAPLSPSGLVNNAGIMNRTYRSDAGGHELTVAVNYVNTRLLTELLLPHLTDGGAVVMTTSITRLMHRGKRLSADVSRRDFRQLGTYGLSKALLTRYAGQLARRTAGRLRVNCADPGVVDSGMITMGRWFDRLADILFRPLIRRPAQGAEPALRAFGAAGSGMIYCRRSTHRIR